MNRIILAEIFAFLFLITIIILLTVFQKASKRVAIEYFRQIPGNLPPAAILYYYQGKMPNNALWITLLDFIQRGFYKLEKVEDNYILTWQQEKLLNISDLNVYDYEKHLLLFINTEIYHFGKDKAIPLEGLKYCMENDPFYKKMANNFFYSLKKLLSQRYGLLPANHISPLMAVLSFLIIYFFGIILYKGNFLNIVGATPAILFFLAHQRASHKPSVANNIITCVLIIIQLLIGYNGIESLIFILGILPTLFATTVTMLQAITAPRDEKQQKLYEEILGFRKFLQDLTRIYEKPIDYIPIYKQYYVLAVGLDVNLKSVEHDEALHDYNVEYASVKIENIPAMMGDSPIYQMNDVGLDRLFPGGYTSFNRIKK